MRPLLSLVMIVKDEARNIGRVLSAVKPFIDRWTILDTGSTDGTQGIVLESLASVQGALHEEPFVDFATTRNRAIELDAPHQSVFSLMLSGDEYLSGGEALREHLEAHRETDVDCHFVRLLIDDTQLYTPRVLRSGCDWKYEGKVHEIPMNRVNPDAPKLAVQGAAIEHVVSDPERRISSVWEHHIPLLEAEVEEKPFDERSLIFLGQSYESMLPYLADGERVTFAMKAMSMYLRRLAIQTGNEVERNWTMCHYLDCARVAGIYTDEELYVRCEELRGLDPHRPETALLLVNAAMKTQPASRVYELACEAAQVAAKVGEIDNSSPVSTSVGWKAHLIAAKAAKRLAERHPDVDTGGGLKYSDRVREHVALGTEAGGPWLAFSSLVGGGIEAEPPKESST